MWLFTDLCQCILILYAIYLNKENHKISLQKHYKCFYIYALYSNLHKAYNIC